MKTMKIVSKRTAIAANPNQSGKLKQLRIERTEHNEYSSKWVQVNDSLKSEAILYPSGVFGLHGGWVFSFVDRFDDEDLMMMKKFENGHSKAAEKKTTKKKPHCKFLYHYCANDMTM